MNKLKELLYTPINPVRVAIFRIVFGVFAFLEMLYFYKTHLIEDYILQPKFLFNYDFLPVSPLSQGNLEILLGICLASTILIILGIWYRVAMLTFFVGFTYFFLLDKAIYNNHFYLFSLLAFLLIFIPADNALTIRKKKKNIENYSWHLRILQFQFIVVYFFGGIAKLNADWLVHLEPVSTLLHYNGYYSLGLAVALTYGGLLFDLFVGFLLLFKRTRVIATIGVLIFNISNHLLFDDINIFPFFMLGSLLLFYDVSQWKPFAKITAIEKIKQTGKHTLTNTLIVCFVILQLLLPLRHLLIPGNVDWTGEGQRFSWRMKIQTRETVTCEFAIFDLDKKVIYPVNIGQYIHPLQVKQMTLYPRMVIDFAHFLKKDAIENYGLKNVMVKADVVVKFNQRKNVAMLSKEIDLTQETWSHFKHNEWIAPLPED